MANVIKGNLKDSDKVLIKYNGRESEITVGEFKGITSPPITNGAVSQTISPTTDVEINTNAGVISLMSWSIAAPGTLVFTVNNSNVLATSTVILTLESDAGFALSMDVENITSGAFDVNIRNNTALTNLGALVKVYFYVIN